MGHESQIEAWSAHGLRRRMIVVSQAELASYLNQQSVFWRVTSHRFVAGSGTTFLLGDLGDSDVRSKDTEMGEGVLLTSPFIEGSRGPLIHLLDGYSMSRRWIKTPRGSSASSAGCAGDSAQDEGVLVNRGRTNGDVE
jgi:hypothetical protein